MGQLTVLENLQTGRLYVRSDRGIGADFERVFEYFPDPEASGGGSCAATLSGGEQQMLAIGRAIMARPKLVLLDEPSLGLAPLVARRIFETDRDDQSRFGDGGAAGGAERRGGAGHFAPGVCAGGGARGSQRQQRGAEGARGRPALVSRVLTAASFSSRSSRVSRRAGFTPAWRWRWC